ncbi:MAG: phage tail tube protein [Marinomonas sp.]|uniref:phage tail tube protein n=1 Tax=Marinomonas sp. TaxID=1904862 RepID=UPI003F9C71FF
MAILGSAVIRGNSKMIKTKPGTVFNPGGYTSTEQEGPNRIWGFSRKFTKPTMQVTIVADEDVDVMEINAMTNVTLTFEGDNGLDYMMIGSEPQEPFSLSDSGEISGTFHGLRAERI